LAKDLLRYLTTLDPLLRGLPEYLLRHLLSLPATHLHLGLRLRSSFHPPHLSGRTSLRLTTAAISSTAPVWITSSAAVAMRIPSAPAVRIAASAAVTPALRIKRT
jgi:hypothetical protein